MRLNWLSVRTLAQLALLTRASYTMLVLVPILAGVWPAVRASINGYNHAASGMIDRADSTLAQLQMYAGALGNMPEANTRRVGGIAAEPRLGLRDSVSSAVSRFDSAIHVVRANRDARSPLSPDMPWSWAAAFFAALAVTFGHLIFESQVPSIVRASHMRDFVQSRLQEYRESPTEGKLRRAMTFVDGPREGFSPEALLKVTSRDRESEDRANLETIEVGASREYIDAANQKRLVALLVLLLYSIGLGLVLMILSKQARSVAEAAGWLS